MKVVFLNVDGVLNSVETFARRYHIFQELGLWHAELDDEYINNLATLVHKKNLFIVLSSSWRLFFSKINNKIIPKDPKGQELLDKLKEYDLDIYDITPVINYNRHEEIIKWLQDNPVDDFIILDDDTLHESKNYDLQELKDHLICTSFKEGFNEKKLAECLFYFNNKVLLKQNML